jgi:nucleoside 2-deoxyribosyltransferase
LRLYLAHPLDSRKAIRERELLFEEVTGIDLVNPFYDIHRGGSLSVDTGTAETWKEDAKDIVERDVETIRNCDGLVAVLTRDQMIGTTMEIAYAHQMGKPVYIVDTAGLGKHPWISYHATAVVESLLQLAGVLGYTNYRRPEDDDAR